MPSGNIQPGYRLDHYTLLERIGFGGEGAVWSAWDNRKHRVVAIKLILLAEGDAEMASFLSFEFERQVHLIASFEHPHILPLYEFGTTDDYFFFVMHYSPFGSLSGTLMRGALPVPDVIRLAGQIVSALAYLHGRGVIYRDLKPSNILLDARGRPYLSDFGLAKRLSQETRAFHTGRGTGPYAPYEQHSQYGMSVESDVFSLGIVLYELFSGQLPWKGEIFLAVQQRQSQRELPDIREANPRLPDTLNKALRRLTAFHWKDRPRTVTDAFDLLLGAFPDYDNVASRRPLQQTRIPQAAELTVIDAKGLLSWLNNSWDGKAESYPARLSHLALIDAAATHPYQPRLELEGGERHFLLRGALVYDFHVEQWWQSTPDPAARLAVCTQTIAHEEDAAVTRALARLRSEPKIFARQELSEKSGARLVELATSHPQWQVRNDALAVLQYALPVATEWRSHCLQPAVDAQLSDMAVLDTAHGRQAAQLIGKVRSQTAVQRLLESESSLGEKRLLEVLQIIQQTAGSLPPIVPAPIRLRMKLALWVKQIFADEEGRAWTRGGIGAAVGLLVGLAMLAGLFAQSNIQMRDVLLAPYPVSDIVTIIEVDDETLATYGRWDSWPRTLHADLIERLQAAGASVVVFDFIFSESTPDDAGLVAVMEQAGNVVQPVLGQGDGFRDTPGVVRYDEYVLPQQNFLRGVAGLGHTNILHDGDGVVRRLPTFIAVDEERFPSLALTAIQLHLTGAETTGTFPTPADGILPFAGREIPVSPTGEMELYYAGPPATADNKTFRTVAYEDVLAGLVPPDIVADKIVLVGITATAEPDRYLTAVSGGRPMYGVEIMANAVEAIWSGKFIHHPGSLFSILLLMVLGLITGLVTYRPWLGLLLAIGVGFLYFLICNLLFDVQAVALDLFYPFTAVGLSYVTVVAYRFSLETRRRRRVMQLFATSVTPDVARATVSAVERGEINLSGQTQDVTVLFVDIRGYKAYSRYDEPEAVLAMLGSFRDMVTTAAHQQEGMLVQAEGGRVMVLFNAPLPQEDHVHRAVRGALAARELVQSYYASLAEDHPERLVNLGYGIYTGRAIVGESGSDRQQKYTALGDTVSLAVELATQAESAQILIGDPVRRVIEPDFDMKSVSPLLVRSSSIPLPAHRVHAAR